MNNVLQIFQHVPKTLRVQRISLKYKRQEALFCAMHALNKPEKTHFHCLIFIFQRPLLKKGIIIILSTILTLFFFFSLFCAPFTLSYYWSAKFISLIFRTSNIFFLCVNHNKYILVFLLFNAFPEKSLVGIFCYYKNILEILFLMTLFIFFYTLYVFINI